MHSQDGDGSGHPTSSAGDDPGDRRSPAGNGIRRTTGTKLLAGGMRLAGGIAPAAAARIAESLYFRAMGARPRAAVEAGEPFSFTVQKRTVTGYVIGEGEPVLLLHGWRGTAGDMSAIALAVAEAGMRAVAIDLPGHGDDRGARTDLFLMGAAVHAAGGLFGRPAGVVAHSFGAVVVFGSFPDGGPRRIAFFGPAIRGDRYLKGFGHHIGLNRRTLDRFVARIERYAGPQLLPILYGRGEVPGADYLIQHDPEDAWTPMVDSERFVDAHPEARLVVVEGVGHKGILRDPEAVRRAARFLAGD
jgi:pimeloyl-ACP methyl ester carboxylesterase